MKIFRLEKSFRANLQGNMPGTAGFIEDMPEPDTGIDDGTQAGHPPFLPVTRSCH
ncbi:MAG: hypothetical protein QOG28_982 [Trebonia sp.]|jgi:hypothetical protein|nr:hypothetical protein [Trebonia sp.]